MYTIFEIFERSSSEPHTIRRKLEKRRMSSLVHYKFKGTRNYHQVTFNGLSIRAGDLKNEIFRIKNLDRSGGSLRLKNVSTKKGT